MPELPEVDTIRRGLEPVLTGARIERVDLRRPNLRFPFPHEFVERLRGRTILGVRRRAKYLVLDLDDGSVLGIHLGMTGTLRTTTRTGPGRDHDHVAFDILSAEGTSLRLVYRDPRRFGYMLLGDVGASSHPKLDDLGVEPTRDLLTAEALARIFAGRRTPLKTLLLDQRAVAGLGNIYVCEALWRAGLSPTRPAGAVVGVDGSPTTALARLATSVVDVIDEAIAAGGSTLRDYRNADGGKGSFQDAFAVYGRDGHPCPARRCGGCVVRSVQAGRATFACDTCQV